MDKDKSEIYQEGLHPYESKSYKVVNEIKPLYQAALGEFLVAFNAVENGTYTLLGMFLRRHGLKHFAAKVEPNSFSIALEYLKALHQDFPGYFEIDFNRLKKLSEFRNRVAHGAFNETFAIGENGEIIVDYQITPKKKQPAERITPEYLKEQTSIADEAYRELVPALITYQLLDAGSGLQSPPAK